MPRPWATVLHGRQRLHHLAAQLDEVLRDVTPCLTPGCRNTARYYPYRQPIAREVSGLDDLPALCGICDLLHNDGEGRRGID